MAFITLSYHPSMPTLWKVFIKNVCWIFSKAFSIFLRWSYGFLFFNLLIWSVALIGLQMTKNRYMPGINPSWSWCLILLKYYGIWFASTLLRIFLFAFITMTVILTCNFLFLWYLVWLWYQCNTSLIEWVEKHSLLSIFWNSLNRIGINSSLNIW